MNNNLHVSVHQGIPLKFSIVNSTVENSEINPPIIPKEHTNQKQFQQSMSPSNHQQTINQQFSINQKPITQYNKSQQIPNQKNIQNTIPQEIKNANNSKQSSNLQKPLVNQLKNPQQLAQTEIKGLNKPQLLVKQSNIPPKSIRPPNPSKTTIQQPIVKSNIPIQQMQTPIAQSTGQNNSIQPPTNKIPLHNNRIYYQSNGIKSPIIHSQYNHANIPVKINGPRLSPRKEKVNNNDNLDKNKVYNTQIIGANSPSLNNQYIKKVNTPLPPKQQSVQQASNVNKYNPSKQISNQSNFPQQPISQTTIQPKVNPQLNQQRPIINQTNILKNNIDIKQTVPTIQSNLPNNIPPSNNHISAKINIQSNIINQPNRKMEIKQQQQYNNQQLMQQNNHPQVIHYSKNHQSNTSPPQQLNKQSNVSPQSWQAPKIQQASIVPSKEENKKQIEEKNNLDNNNNAIHSKRNDNFPTASTIQNISLSVSSMPQNPFAS